MPYLPEIQQPPQQQLQSSDPASPFDSGAAKRQQGSCLGASLNDSLHYACAPNVLNSQSPDINSLIQNQGMIAVHPQFSSNSFNVAPAQALLQNAIHLQTLTPQNSGFQEPGAAGLPDFLSWMGAREINNSQMHQEHNNNNNILSSTQSTGGITNFNPNLIMASTQNNNTDQQQTQDFDQKPAAQSKSECHDLKPNVAYTNTPNLFANQYANITASSGRNDCELRRREISKLPPTGLEARSTNITSNINAQTLQVASQDSNRAAIRPETVALLMQPPNTPILREFAETYLQYFSSSGSDDNKCENQERVRDGD